VHGHSSWSTFGLHLVMKGPWTMKTNILVTRTMEVVPWSRPTQNRPLTWDGFMVHSVNCPWVNSFFTLQEIYISILLFFNADYAPHITTTLEKLITNGRQLHSRWFACTLKVVCMGSLHLIMIIMLGRLVAYNLGFMTRQLTLQHIKLSNFLINIQWWDQHILSDLPRNINLADQSLNDLGVQGFTRRYIISSEVSIMDEI
jgi:hypothetical protein